MRGDQRYRGCQKSFKREVSFTNCCSYSVHQAELQFRLVYSPSKKKDVKEEGENEYYWPCHKN